MTASDGFFDHTGPSWKFGSRSQIMRKLVMAVLGIWIAVGSKYERAKERPMALTEGL